MTTTVAALLTEAIRFDQIEPDAYTTNTYTTSWLSMRDFARLTALILVGALGTNATLDAKLQQAKDDGGSGAKDITGKAITQLTQAGSDSDKMVAIELDASELDVNGKFDHVRLSITLGTATSDFGAVVMRHQPLYGPVDDSNLDEVKA
jgi:hypothetical protein